MSVRYELHLRQQSFGIETKKRNRTTSLTFVESIDANAPIVTNCSLDDQSIFKYNFDL